MPSSKPDQSTIGDSWVVDGANPTIEETTNKAAPANGSTQQSEGRYATRSRSRATTPAVTSGPELVMPSLQASTMTDGSWIVPNPETETEDAAPTRRRPLTSTNGNTSQAMPDLVKQDAPPENASEPTTATSSSEQSNTESRPKILQILGTYSSIISVVYYIFLLGVLRFVWIPKLIPYYPDICQHSLVWSTYPDTCLSLETAETMEVGPSFAPPSEYQYLIDSHNRLESIVNSTAKEISQAPELIRQTETELEHAYRIFESSPIDAVFELELEYESAINAIRTARQRCDSLNIKVETTVSGAPSESRRFQRILSYAAHLDESDTGFKSVASKYLKALLSLNIEKSDRTVLEDQFARHDLVLDQITSFLIADSNAILKDLATINEHFQAIKDIARRENERLGNPDCDPDSDSDHDGPLAALLKVFGVPVDSKIGTYINPKKVACETLSEEDSVPSALTTLSDAGKPADSLTYIFKNLVQELEIVRAEWEAGSKLMQERRQSETTAA
ncbi:hypothetical protein FQN54_001250 [Arachnomyces sp. PD_36]|nr:hypothetical protein FQN54_001250 [Arachnomyces sp. PD_36]